MGKEHLVKVDFDKSSSQVEKELKKLKNLRNKKGKKN